MSFDFPAFANRVLAGPNPLNAAPREILADAAIVLDAVAREPERALPLARNINLAVGSAMARLQTRLGVNCDLAADIVRDAVNAGVDLGAGFERAEFAGEGMKLAREQRRERMEGRS